MENKPHYVIFIEHNTEKGSKLSIQKDLPKKSFNETLDYIFMKDLINLDLYTILGDFLACDKSDPTKPPKRYNGKEYYLNEDTINALNDCPLLLGYKQPHTYKEPPKYLVKLFDGLEWLKDIVKKYESINIVDFETTIRTSDWLTLDYDIKNNEIVNKNVNQTKFSFSTDLLSYTDEDGKESVYLARNDFKYNTPQLDKFTINYTCYNICDVIIAILHYYIRTGLKFTACQHCGRMFATKSLKNKYCNRKSLHDSYKDFECGKAVNAIVDKCQKRYKQVYNNQTASGLYQCNSEKREFVYEIQNKYISLKQEVKKCSSIANLKALEEYICSNDYKIRRSKK